MTPEDFRKVIEVHLVGAFNCSKAVWETMRGQKYGRIVFTSSSSGLFGYFGQSNYGAAKMGVVGLMNVLHIEGARYNIHVNVLSPTAATRMTEDIFPESVSGLFAPELVSPGIVFLSGQDAPSRKILLGGAGNFAVAKLFATEGVNFAPEHLTAEAIADEWEKIDNSNTQTEYKAGGELFSFFGGRAATRQDIKLD